MKMPDLASYMQTVIEQLEADKKRSAAHTYTYALKSIAEFYGGAGMPMPVDEVFTPGRLKEYEEWMRREGMRKRKREPKGLSLNTISTYMRNLKAVYHRMVGEKVLPSELRYWEENRGRAPQDRRALVQQVVIDPEGDFVTLAEPFGHVVIDGAAYSPAEIEALARRIREHRASVESAHAPCPTSSCRARGPAGRRAAAGCGASACVHRC